MKVMYERVAGIDVRKEMVKVAVRSPGAEPWTRRTGVLAFGTFYGQLREMARELRRREVTHVAMEAPGVYTGPVYEALEEEGWFAEILVVNPAHVKAVKGAQDRCEGLRAARGAAGVRDAAGLVPAAAGAAGDAGPGPVPGKEGPGPHLGDPAAGQDAGIGRHQARLSCLRGMCRLILDQVKTLDAAVAVAGAQIAARAAAWEREIALLTTIPGFGDATAWAWIAGIGPVPHQWFASQDKLASWAGLAPGNHVSAGKRRYGRTGDAGTWIKPALVQAAWAAIRVRGRLQARYHRLVRKMGGEKNPAARKKAIVAIAHTLVKIACSVLKSGQPCTEPGQDFCARRESPAQRQACHERQIQKLCPGCTVTITITPPPGGPQDGTPPGRAPDAA